jgi:hypothetical protein
VIRLAAATGAGRYAGRTAGDLHLRRRTNPEARLDGARFFVWNAAIDAVWTHRFARTRATQRARTDAWRVAPETDVREGLVRTAELSAALR